MVFVIDDKCNNFDHISVVDDNYNNNIDQQEPPPKSNDIEIHLPEQVDFLDLDAEQNYYRRNLKFTLAPLLVCGLPIYLFFLHGKRNGKGILKTPQPNSVLEWLLFLLKASKSSVILSILNAIFFIFALIVNFIFLMKIYNVVDALLIIGEFRDEVLVSTLTALRGILLLVGMNGAWIYGHRFRTLLTSLGSIRPPEQIPHKLLPCVRLRLGLMYAILTAIHVIHGYMFLAQRVKGRGYESWYIWSWISYFHDPLLASAFFPLYCGVAWTLCRHCTLLGAYLQNTYAPADEVLPAFKQYFKELSTCYQSITALFCPYFSWVILVHLFSVSEEISDFGYLVTHTNGNVGLSPPWPPAIVRGFVTLFILLSLKIGLVIHAVFVTAQANTEARYLRVALNDFMCREEQKNVSTDTYQTYRVLKYYVKSRLVGAKASILYIPVVSSIGHISRASLGTLILTFTQISLVVSYIFRDNEERSFGGFLGGIMGKSGNNTSALF